MNLCLGVYATDVHANCIEVFMYTANTCTVLHHGSHVSQVLFAQQKQMLHKANAKQARRQRVIILHDPSRRVLLIVMVLLLAVFNLFPSGSLMNPFGSFSGILFVIEGCNILLISFWIAVELTWRSLTTIDVYGIANENECENCQVKMNIYEFMFHTRF